MSALDRRVAATRRPYPQDAAAEEANVPSAPSSPDLELHDHNYWAPDAEHLSDRSVGH